MVRKGFVWNDATLKLTFNNIKYHLIINFHTELIKWTEWGGKLTDGAPEKYFEHSIATINQLWLQVHLAILKISVWVDLVEAGSHKLFVKPSPNIEWSNVMWLYAACATRLGKKEEAGNTERSYFVGDFWGVQLVACSSSFENAIYMLLVVSLTPQYFKLICYGKMQRTF